MSRSLSKALHLLCLGFVLSVGAASAAEYPAKALDERFLKAFNANDLEAILACYADDAVIYPPDAFIARGKDAIRRNWQEFLGQFRLSNAKISDARYLDLVTRGLLWSCDKLNDTYLKPVPKAAVWIIRNIAATTISRIRSSWPKL